MSFPTLTIDLDEPPEQRWLVLEPHVAAVRELVAYYVRDIGGIGAYRTLLELYVAQFVPADQQRELAAIAALAGVDPTELALGNLYYDAIKYVLACTAFGVRTADGPLLARNLDWWTQDRALARHTVVLRYVRSGRDVCTVVGWPGFVGCLSGVAPGRFAVTLNAVLGSDAPEMAPPVTLLLRSVLENASSFDEALAILQSSRISSDCLLLLVGADGQMAVIERSPTRSAVRRDSVPLLVTNDYRALDVGEGPSRGELAETSCGRFDRARSLLDATPPASPQDCLAILSDPRVKMGITVQQMVFDVRSGRVTLQAP
jgi:acid ceramidase